MISTFESYLDGPRWAFSPALIERYAMDFGVEVDYVREERRLFTRTVFFRVSGEAKHVAAFREAFHEGVRNWNAGRVRP